LTVNVVVWPGSTQVPGCSEMLKSLALVPLVQALPTLRPAVPVLVIV